MPLSLAAKLEFPLSLAKMRIKPKSSKTMQCIGYYLGVAMHNGAVANVGIYIVDNQVEALLSGPACEALGIISFHGEYI